jgi:hypothetical protein
MKIMTISLIILNTYFCNSSKGFVFNSGPLHELLFDTTSNYEKLIGNWRIYEYKSKYFNSGKAFDSSAQTCNACPTIRFNKNNKAEVIVPRGTTEQLGWKIINDKIVLTNETKTNKHVTFPDKEYTISITRKSDFDKLELSFFEEKYSISYILYR